MSEIIFKKQNGDPNYLENVLFTKFELDELSMYCMIGIDNRTLNRRQVANC